MRVRPRAVALAVVTVALTLLALRVLESAGRVLGWLAMAAAVAALLTPIVGALSRRIPRGLAIAVVAISSLGVIGGVAYGLVGDVVEQTRVLQRVAPERAKELEETGRFAEAAKDARLSERVARIVADVPERLRGGSPADAVRSATTRGLAFLAVTVLTVFLVLHGPRLLDGARLQIRDDGWRRRAEQLTNAIEARALAYARGTALTAALSGAYAFVVASAAGVPGPAPLAVWIALWDLVPLIGAVVGAVPVVVLAAMDEPAQGVAVALAFGAWQVFEDLVLQRPLEKRTVKVGPFLTLAAGMGGLELYGLAGALLAIVAAAIGLVVAEVVSEPDRVPQLHGDE